QGDMNLAYLVIGGSLIFFVLFAVLLSLLSSKVTWLSGNIDRRTEYGAGFHEKYEKFEYVVFLLIFAEFSLAVLCKMIQMAAGISWLEQIFPVLQILLLIPAGICSVQYVKHGKTGLMKRAVEWSQ